MAMLDAPTATPETNVPALADELRAALRAADAATTCAELGAVYERLVGYDLHVDDPSMSADDLRDQIHDYVYHCWAENNLGPIGVGLE